MSRKKKNEKKRRLKALRKSLKQSNKMPDNEKPTFREQLMGVFSGGREAQPSTEGHVQDLQRRLNAGGGDATGAGDTPAHIVDEWGGWRGYGPTKGLTGTKPNANTSYSGTTSSHSQSNTLAGVVVLLDAEGKRNGFTFKITQGWKDWWRVASRFYVVEKDEMFIPASRVTLSYGKVSFNACVYQSSEDYIAARWGRKLHYTDREWLSEHPYATDGGVPSEYTPICVQALLEPYGMGVSRVRLRRGTLAAGPEMMKFMVALGCNPFAMADHTTTNKEAAEKLGITEKEANDIFRFEFSDDALPGSVCCEKGYAQTGVATGSGGGHARYLAPRDKASNWVVSLQCAPLEQIDYNTPIELPEYIPRKGEPKLELEHVLQPMEELPVGIKYNNDFYFHEELAEKLETKKREDEKTKAWNEQNRSHVKVQGTVAEDAKPQGPQRTVAEVLISTLRRTNGLTTERPVQLLDANGQPTKRSRFALKHKCTKCNKSKFWSSFANGTEICTDCVDTAFAGFHCPKCKSDLVDRMVPEFVRKDYKHGQLEATFICNKTGCGQQILITQNDQNSLVELLPYLPLSTGESFDREVTLFIYNSNMLNFDEWWVKVHPDDAPSVQTEADKQAELLLATPQLEANVNTISSETVQLH